MSIDEVRIPKERISILIGKNGTDKRMIERKTNTKLRVDSKEGIVTIEGDFLNVFNAKPVVKAIGRGFNPSVAEELLDEDYLLEIINIKDFAKTKQDLTRIKARIIGRKGTCRKNMESLTNTTIVVYGKTVGIIGTIQECINAKQAIEKLLNGAKHGNVYKWLERKRGEERIEKIKGKR